MNSFGFSRDLICVITCYMDMLYCKLIAVDQLDMVNNCYTCYLKCETILARPCKPKISMQRRGSHTVAVPA